MMNSLAAHMLREKFKQGGCRGVERFDYDSYDAALDTLLNPITANPFSTSAQVGGFARASAINNGNGKVIYTIPNVAGAHSFFYHRIPDAAWANGPLRNIEQTFRWAEPIECKSQGRAG